VDSIWQDNFFEDREQSFTTLNSSLSYSLNSGKLQLRPMVALNYVKAEENYAYPAQGIIYDDYFKVTDFSFNTSLTMTHISPGLEILFNPSQNGFFSQLKGSWNSYSYNGDNWTEKISLTAIDLLARAGIRGEKVYAALSYSRFSLPLNLSQLSKFGRKGSSFTISVLEEGVWENMGQTPASEYIFHDGDKFNTQQRIDFTLTATIKKTLLSLSFVYQTSDDFWEQMRLEEGTFHIGAVDDSNEAIALAPQRTFAGVHASARIEMKKALLDIGASYLKTRGNYDNPYFSSISSFNAGSLLFLDGTLQSQFSEDYDMAFGNGFKFYLKGDIKVTKSFQAHLSFLYLPPINYIPYTFAPSLSLYTPLSKRESGETLTLLSAALSYQKSRFSLFIGAKNLLNSTPGLFFSGIDSQPLRTFMGLTTIMGIQYRL